MKYVVSGYIGFDNFGDEAIAKVLTQKLKSEGADKITLISSNPQKTSKLYDVESCGMLKFFNPIKNSDILISGGGSLLQDSTSLKSLIYYLVIIFTALFMKKKVEIFAQGIGPINSFIGRFLTKIALKHAYKISVRDTKSQALLNSWGIHSILVKDPVLEIKIPNKNKKGTVGVQLRAFEGVDEKFLLKLAKEITAKFSDKKFEIISLQDSIDMDVCSKFAELLKTLGQNNIEIINNLDLNSAFERLSDLEYLVAMRFHANVVGIKSGVKTLAISYDPKVEKLAEEYNLPLIKLNDKDFSVAFNML